MKLTNKDLVHRSIAILFLAVGFLSGCSTSEVLVAHSIDLIQAQAELPEEQLLDVGIRVFDPGVPDGEIDKEALEELLDDRVFVHIRRSESVSMAVQLRDTMQQSGRWGTVLVTPRESSASDLNVTARILRSDGYLVRVEVEAVDAAGRMWIDRPYEFQIPAGAYNRQRYPGLDPYQDLFNSIANDLAVAAARIPAAEAAKIRTVAALRYASELSPAAFDGYVAADRRGMLVPVHLPASADPMFERTQLARQRERLFLETLNLHYESFRSRAAPSYDQWREAAREESVGIREMTRATRWRKGLGIAAMVASMIYDGGISSGFADSVMRESMISMAFGMLDMSAVSEEGRRLHEASLEELSTSFDDEVEPMVAEIGGTEHRLTGTAEEQYQEWRRLLEQLFVEETGGAGNASADGNANGNANGSRDAQQQD